MHSKVNKIEEKFKLLEQKSECFSILDYKITTGELQKIFSKLKSGKSPGLDNVSNEMLKASQSYMNPCLLKLFNAVFTSGIYPSKWSERQMILIILLTIEEYQLITVLVNCLI